MYIYYKWSFGSISTLFPHLVILWRDCQGGWLSPTGLSLPCYLLLSSDISHYICHIFCYTSTLKEKMSLKVVQHLANPLGENCWSFVDCYFKKHNPEDLCWGELLWEMNKNPFTPPWHQTEMRKGSQQRSHTNVESSVETSLDSNLDWQLSYSLLVLCIMNT